ncbi:hypothetical protein F4777DRAFT_596743 [Nemania sp. FL0916]|nr:hypothetical protein F4777DRAFT_596743 [Nemania sp. FL0916]
MADRNSDKEASDGSSVTSASSNSEESSYYGEVDGQPFMSNSDLSLGDQILVYSRLSNGYMVDVTAGEQHDENGKEAHCTDTDGESTVPDDDANGSFAGSTLDNDWGEEVAPEDSISVKDGDRGSYDGASDDDHSDNGTIYLDSVKKPKYEDRLTRLKYVDRMPDIDGKRHYRIELAGDKKLEEDRICTALRTLDLSSSPIPMLNKDGLSPKRASDLLTFSNQFMEVRKSPVAGYGVFAVRDLEPLTTVLVEKELFSANSSDLYDRLDELTPEQMKAFHDLHGHKRSPTEELRAAIWRTNRHVFLSVFFFATPRSTSIFLVGSRFNHACGDWTNVEYAYDKAMRCMVFTTRNHRTIKAGDELFIRYGSDARRLYKTWGFRCACGACAAAPDHYLKNGEDGDGDKGEEKDGVGDSDWENYDANGWHV